MKPLPLSFSALQRFKNCPKQFHEVRVLHSVEDIVGAEGKWGNYVHKEFENYLERGGIYDLPENVAQYQPYLDGILDKPGDMLVEQELCIDTSLQQCDFFAPNVFIRGYADVLRMLGPRAWILDHKTGKRKPDSNQMRMMALLVFAIYPQIEHIRVSFAWLQEGVSDGEEFTRADWSMLLNTFLPDIVQYRDAFAKDIWQPRQSGLCAGWCPVTQCEYWKPKRVRGRP
jgi:hypothetical protein